MSPRYQIIKHKLSSFVQRGNTRILGGNLDRGGRLKLEYGQHTLLRPQICLLLNKLRQQWAPYLLLMALRFMQAMAHPSAPKPRLQVSLRWHDVRASAQTQAGLVSQQRALCNSLKRLGHLASALCPPCRPATPLSPCKTGACPIHAQEK